MWTTSNWTDYEILAASDGEKLERWGKYLLIRPDPQVIWQTEKTHPGWKRPNAHYHRSVKGGGEWEFFDLPEEWNIGYKDLLFRLKPFSFKHTGIFPEQAVNWDWCAEKISAGEKRLNRPLKILNLFAYTGGATVSAAKAGANITHVDAAKGMVSWAKENAEASGLSAKPIRWLVDDCVKFAEREIRRGNTYDGIIMDPPSYGRGPKGEIWKMEENIFAFIKLTAQLLDKEASFFLINSYTTGLQPAVLSYMLNTAIVPRLGGLVKADEIGLPVTENGLILPCGASGRWFASEDF
ncbi:MAG: class I SAM-dependent methyltransferase [Lachnospiraceae bacterium]|nr:class I SAM-dependent methyltransferase [Lachnospiraceae bacterium]